MRCRQPADGVPRCSRPGASGGCHAGDQGTAPTMERGAEGADAGRSAGRPKRRGPQGRLTGVTALMANRDQVEEFCRQQHPRLVRSLAVYTGDRDLAEELAQEALARAYRDWARVRALDRPEAWAHRVAINLANSHFRRRRHEQAARRRAAARTPVAWTDPEPPLGPALLEALAGVTRRQREALVLRFVLDLSVSSTAEHMRCAEGTVRALTAQGVAALRRDTRLSHLEEPPDD